MLASKILIISGFLSCLSNQVIAQEQAFVISVSGAVPKNKLGITLPHEHILVDFIGADQVNANCYNPDDVFVRVLPYLQKLKQTGCKTLVDCTPAYLGRDVKLLQRLSRASGLTILTNTGYYSAVQNKYLPAHAFTETPEQLASRWITEAEQGIEKTNIKPGFIKISVDAGPLTTVNQNLVKAAAITHLKTGLTIASHTGNGEAALSQIKLLQQNNVSGKAFIWVHAQNEKDNQLHLAAAKAGAWIEFDGINSNNVPVYITILQKMKAAGFLKQTLISQDAGWYHVGEKNGGKFQQYDTLFTVFLPALKKAGFKPSEIRQLIEINPQEAFAKKVRPQ
ncbi:phosphotriesterase [Adhaeribacter swui]|uniref:Phosphotriesterase n=1 Tax=Adhaeribacter swui TaxID=2086471 RepID=A0A7G7G2U0_9BACT|nr:phosphotriesterase [Adhaeribacter swui]QNF31474.1 phosphotriesterase [Adhaeribacter swui]